MSDKACDLDTYVVADCSSVSDGFVAFATCNGGDEGDCGWDLDLGQSVAIDRAAWLDLDEAHRRHSATVAVTR